MKVAGDTKLESSVKTEEDQNIIQSCDMEHFKWYDVYKVLNQALGAQ